MSGSVTLVAFAALIVLSSCEEDPTKIGNRLLPSSDFVSVSSTDTLSVWAYTEYSNAIVSSNPSTAYLGALYDPYFGLTTAEFITQLRLSQEWKSSSFNLDADDTLKIDEIKLYLRFLTTKGYGKDTHYIKISEIKNRLYNETDYYSNQDIELEGYVMPPIQLPSLRTDTINSIVLDLPLSFAERLVQDTTKLFHHSKEPDFRDYFKGIFMQIESKNKNKPVLVSFDAGNNSYYGIYSNYIVISLHDKADATKKYNYTFLIDAVSRNAAYLKYTHEFDEATSALKASNINNNVRDSLVYLQVMNGLYTKVKIPGLETLKSNPAMRNVAVNKARLTLPVMYDGSIYKASTIPTQLLVRYKDADGEKFYVPDLVKGADYFNGTPDSSKNVYSVNLAMYVQNYLRDTENKYKPELELFLLPSANNNAILKANGKLKRFKFDFTYTSF